MLSKGSRYVVGGLKILKSTLLCATIIGVYLLFCISKTIKYLLSCYLITGDSLTIYWYVEILKAQFHFEHLTYQHDAQFKILVLKCCLLSTTYHNHFAYSTYKYKCIMFVHSQCLTSWYHYITYFGVVVRIVLHTKVYNIITIHFTKKKFVFLKATG